MKTLSAEILKANAKLRKAEKAKVRVPFARPTEAIPSAKAYRREKRVSFAGDF
jgi:hypothetical protein